MVGIKAIREAILEGVQTANVRYENWSGGWWLTDSGIEGHVVSTIAGKLHGQIGGNGYVVMELAFGDIREWSGAGRPRGRPRQTLSEGNRADIVILNKREHPIHVIEVKRVWSKEPCFEDLTRMRDLILGFGPEKGGSLRRGLLTFLVAGWETREMTAQRCLERQVEEIGRVVGEVSQTRDLELTCYQGSVRRYPKKYRERHDETKWVHSAVCIELRGT